MLILFLKILVTFLIIISIINYKKYSNGKDIVSVLITTLSVIFGAILFAILVLLIKGVS